MSVGIVITGSGVRVGRLVMFLYTPVAEQEVKAIVIAIITIITIAKTKVFLFSIFLFTPYFLYQNFYVLHIA
jgi:hypothetical protein